MMISIQEPWPVYKMTQQYEADGRLLFWHNLGARRLLWLRIRRTLEHDIL